MIPRIVEPELLDSLPPDDPRAIHSRRDLRVINRWMGNARHIATAVRGLPCPPKRIVELGAGDGSLWLQMADVVPENAELLLVDMQPVVADQTLQSMREKGWKPGVARARVEDWLLSADRGAADLIVANLFLHHFTEDALRKIFSRVAVLTRAFISCDPRRWRPALLSTRLLWVLGCNAVTRFDARVSVRAGFREKELSALWPAGVGFELEEAPAGVASHRFTASLLAHPLGDDPGGQALPRSKAELQL